MLKETKTAPTTPQFLNGTVTTHTNTKPGRDAGLAAGTLVETAVGWRAVELLRVGDHVHTLDGGLRQVRRVERTYYGETRGGYALDGVLHVPGGAIGNCDAMVLMPQQQVMMMSRVAEDLLGVPMVLLPASALDGYRGISRTAVDGLVEAITLGFDDEEIVYANSGVLMQCAGTVGSDFFTVLDHGRAKALVSLLDRDAQIMGVATAMMRGQEPQKQAA